ncbi:GNAT family N-acetyltransferase [Cronobacter muytjensii]|nr:GNAT family N-acetyltransferase [Cronobacter muytjensii]
MGKIKRLLYGWEKSSAETYRQCYKKNGGSINVHPDVIDFIIKRTGQSVDYFHRKVKNEIIGSYPLINNKSVGAKVWNLYPVSYDDVLFPFSESGRAMFPERCNRISPFLKDSLLNVNYKIARKGNVCIVKEGFSSKTEKNRRNEYRKFIDAGGTCIDQSAFSAKDLAGLYIKLFNARFQGKVRCHSEENLTDIISSLRPLIFGKVLFVGDAPCAFDLVFRAESDDMIYFDVPNGGLDPSYSHLSPGSLAMWQNIQAAKADCEHKKKKMIFSIGALKKEWSYKLRWANVVKTGKPFI